MDTINSDMRVYTLNTFNTNSLGFVTNREIERRKQMHIIDKGRFLIAPNLWMDMVIPPPLRTIGSPPSNI